MSESLLPVAGLCKFLSVSRATIFRWCDAGMPAAVRRGRILRFRASDVEAWLAAGPSPRAAANGKARRGRPKNFDRGRLT